jgi:hypothetical protein
MGHLVFEQDTGVKLRAETTYSPIQSSGNYMDHLT